METPLENDGAAGLRTEATPGAHPPGRTRHGRWHRPADPSARVGHIGLYRDQQTLRPHDYYFKIPGAGGVRDFFVLDPMLATGGSAVAAVDALKQAGRPPDPFSLSGCRPGGSLPHARKPIRTFRSSPLRSIANSTSTATSCPAWATPGTGCSGQGKRKATCNASWSTPYEPRAELDVLGRRRPGHRLDAPPRGRRCPGSARRRALPGAAPNPPS